MPFTCRAIIFDLDGVLVDSEAAIEQRWREWAEYRDIPFEEVEAVYHGRPMFEVIREVAPHLDVEAEVEKMSDVMTAAPELLRPFDGAKALLERLPEARWTIATSGRARTATNRLSHVGLPIPELMVTADDVEHGKPHPESYLTAADRLDIAPENCLVFEDAPAGVEAARRAGATAIGVATVSAPESLASADAVVDTIADVEVQQNGTEILHVHTEETGNA
jgi:sugar-phosphatase